MNLKKNLVFIFSLFSSILVTSISIDGNLDEPEWQKAKLISDFVTVYPNDKLKLLGFQKFLFHGK